MKAELKITIETEGEEITISCSSDPKHLPHGPLKIAGDMVANKVGNAIKEFYDDVKILNKAKKECDIPELEYATITVRVIRAGTRHHVDLKGTDYTDIQDPTFRAFAMKVINEVTECLDKIHEEKNTTDGIRSRFVSDEALKAQAWAQRN